MIWGQWLGNKQQKFKKLRIIGICSVNKKQGTGALDVMGVSGTSDRKLELLSLVVQTA